MNYKGNIFLGYVNPCNINYNAKFVKITDFFIIFCIKNEYPRHIFFRKVPRNPPQNEQIQERTPGGKIKQSKKQQTLKTRNSKV